jgi:hypothetical protein
MAGGFFYIISITLFIGQVFILKVKLIAVLFILLTAGSLYSLGIGIEGYGGGGFTDFGKSYGSGGISFAFGDIYKPFGALGLAAGADTQYIRTTLYFHRYPVFFDLGEYFQFFLGLGALIDIGIDYRAGRQREATLAAAFVGALGVRYLISEWLEAFFLFTPSVGVGGAINTGGDPFGVYGQLGAVLGIRFWI